MIVFNKKQFYKIIRQKTIKYLLSFQFKNEQLYLQRLEEFFINEKVNDANYYINVLYDEYKRNCKHSIIFFLVLFVIGFIIYNFFGKHFEHYLFMFVGIIICAFGEQIYYIKNLTFIEYKAARFYLMKII